MASLVVIKGPDRGKRYELVDEVSTIGRDIKNTIRMHDSEASRRHAEVLRTDDGFVLCDLQSSNGTLLNDNAIAQSAMKSGDKIRLGQTEMIFVGDQSHSLTGTALAERINMISQQRVEDASGILRAMKHSEGSQYLHHPERAESRWLKDALACLEIMYESSRAINTISDLGQLLDRIMDLIFQSIEADRGCILLKDPDSGEFKPTAVRYAAGVDREEKITLSRTIVDWVLQRDEGVIVLDAPHDQRFGESASVVKLGIREAMCVPLNGRHEALGVVYLDIKSDQAMILETQRPVKLTDDHLRLMIAIAHQAGLAIEDTRLYQAMVHAERLAAVGQTITALSHHIKNILQGVRSGSYLIEMGMKDHNFEILEQGWGVVQKNQEKIYNLVMDMLSYSKEREPAIEPTDTTGLTRDVIELMEPRATQLGITLTAVLDDTVPLVGLDSEGIHRALLNIVTNAIDAVENRDGAQVIVKNSLSSDGRFLQLSVEDNGPGIAADELPKIFQIFNSSKGARGSGLGLAVSRKIVKEHGGDVKVVSQPEKGSTFTIVIPRREPEQSSNFEADPHKTLV